MRNSLCEFQREYLDDRNGRGTDALLGSEGREIPRIHDEQ